MAVLHVTFLSDSLKRTVPITVILPVDKIVNGSSAVPVQGYKTLYLLHGLLGSCNDWLYNSRVQQWAEAKNLAVVMPSGDNSFYVDQLTPNNDYGTFIGKELVEITRKMFPLSHRREDTFLAGLSMGGYGAIRNGLVYGETFSHIAGLSSAVHLFELPPETPGRTLISEDLVFGDMKAASKTDKNPRIALSLLKARSGPIPKMYLSCGLQDSLLDSNRTLRDYFLSMGVDVIWEECDGTHNWDFWNDQLQKVLDWLPLDEDTPGLSSGNVNG